MIITTTTTIGFFVPSEEEAQRAFAETNDMSEWKMEETSGIIWYTKKDLQYRPC